MIFENNWVFRAMRKAGTEWRFLMWGGKSGSRYLDRRRRRRASQTGSVSSWQQLRWLQRNGDGDVQIFCVEFDDIVAVCWPTLIKSSVHHGDNLEQFFITCNPQILKTRRKEIRKCLLAQWQRLLVLERVRDASESSRQHGMRACAADALQPQQQQLLRL